MSKNSFLRGAMVLTVAGIVVKILGGLNRIFLSRLLGGEGIGLYQMAYPVYILLLSIIGAGIPIAVSIMIAEEAAKGHYSGVRRIFHVTLAFMTVVAVVCGLALPFGAHGLVEMGIVRDSRAFPALAVLAPALSLSVIACCFRGYFQGLQLMTPTALSQMADQFVRVCTMLVLAWILLPKGLEWAAAGAAFGASGAAAGLVLIGFLYYRHSRIHAPMTTAVFVIQSPRRIIRRLIVLAVPVAAANMLLPAVASIDLFIVPLRLEAAGYSTHQATALYGYLTGMANGLVQLPAILTIALATSLVPAVSAAFSQRNRDVILDRTDTAMRIANVITVPACLGLAVLAVPISRLLYATPAAGPAICVLSISVFLVGLQQITSGLLQGMGHTAVPLYNMAAAAVVKIILSWHLTAIPWLGEVGAAWATNADLAVATALNLYFARKYIAYRVQWGYIGKLFLAGARHGRHGLARPPRPVRPLRQRRGHHRRHHGCSLVYLIGLVVFRALTAEDIEKIPVVGRK